MRHLLAFLLLCLVLLAATSFSFASSDLTQELRVAIPNSQTEETASVTALSDVNDQIVSTWNDQILEWDELTRCIRGSEAGNAIERWLDCLEHLEGGSPKLSQDSQPSGIPEIPKQVSDSQVTIIEHSMPRRDEMEGDLGSGEGRMPTVAVKDKEIDEKLRVFDPLAGIVSSKSSDEYLTRPRKSDFKGSELHHRGEEPNQAGDQRPFVSKELHKQRHELDLRTQRRKNSKEDGFDGNGGDYVMGICSDNDSCAGPCDVDSAEARKRSQVPVLSDVSRGIEILRAETDGTRRGDGKDKGSGRESSTVHTESEMCESSVCSGEYTRSEVSKTMTSATRTQNVMDALTLATCLGVAVTLLWRKKRRLGAEGVPLVEQIVDYPRGSETEFSMTGLSSSNTEDVNFPNASAGNLPAPLGMAIATVMAKKVGMESQRGSLLIQQVSERGQEGPLSADDLTKMLEAAMNESLSSVMGNECAGFVEQFKESFRKTYRLFEIVHNASSKKPARASFSKQSPRISRRPSESLGKIYSRRNHDDDCRTGVSTSSRGEKLDRRLESSSRTNILAPDSQRDLVGQFDKLSVSSRKPEAEEEIQPSGSGNTVSGTSYSSGRAGSAYVDQDVFGDLGDLERSSFGPDVSEGLSERGKEEHCSDNDCPVHEMGATNRWLRGGGLVQLASRGLPDNFPFQSASKQVGEGQPVSSLETSDLSLALQPFNPTQPGQLVAGSQEEKLLLSQQEMIRVLNQQNILKSWELAYQFKGLNMKEAGLSMKEANLRLKSDSNSLMRESVDLSRDKAEFREAEFQDRKLVAAYADFTRTCADELVAGLCVMLCALFYGGYKYSYSRLVDVVSTCQPSLHEPSNSMIPGMNKMVNSLNHLSSQLQMFVCEVTVASRMLLGLGIISIVAASLLRKSVTSNSQAMPATILIIVLGGLCGIAGKFAVDSMGGSGFHWLLIWESLCLIHASATCFTSFVYWLLNGSPQSTSRKRRFHCFVSPWLRRLLFHITVVLIVPAMAGLLPFAPVREVLRMLSSTFLNVVFAPIEAYWRGRFRFIFL